jgi:acyl carrier protein
MTVEKIFAEVFGLPESSIDDGLKLSAIATWDSMAHMQLIVALEESFKVQFSGDEIADMKSVGDARQLLKAHGATA